MSHIRLLAIAIIVANTLLASIASGDNKTNINEVTSFFKDNLENREQIESILGVCCRMYNKYQFC